MVNQYPHTLEVESITNPTQNISGDWIGGSSSFNQICVCRDTPNGAGKMLNLTDGKNIIYNSILYCPLGDYSISVNDKIRVMDNGSVRLEGTVLRISKGQFNVRIWV